jgi:hypothetical protein
MLFKTIARETSEYRSGFSQVPAGISLGQGVSLLDQGESSSALISPASLSFNR